MRKFYEEVPTTEEPAAVSGPPPMPAAPGSIASLPPALLAQLKADPRQSGIAAMRAQASDTRPINHWLQGLARVAGAISAKVQEGRLEDDYLERAKSY
jgi:hypothetical protein